MKVSLVPSQRGKKLFSVELTQGSQRFRLDFDAPEDEARWYARMFRKALKNMLEQGK